MACNFSAINKHPSIDLKVGENDWAHGGHGLTSDGLMKKLKGIQT